MKKVNVLLAALFFLNQFCFSYPELAVFLENDLELKRLAIEVQKASISNKNTKLDNSFNVVLSSGDVKFSTVGDESRIQFTPKATVSIPQASNLSLGISSNMKFVDGQDKSGDTKFSLSADIVSGSLLTRKLKLMSAKRSLLKAKRDFQNRALEAEKEYYTELKNLYNSASSIVSSQRSMYEDRIEFEEIKAKGFATSSSKYRLAEMKVVSDKHDVENKIREFNHDCAVFAKKCGVEFSESDNPSDFLPKQINLVEPVDVRLFDKNTYKKIEEANYNSLYNSLNRKANKNFNLTASAGYTLKNTDTSKNVTSSSIPINADTSDASDTLDVDLKASFYGISIGGGASIPVAGENKNLAYRASVSVNPVQFLETKNKNMTNYLNEQQEDISLESAEESYETSVIDQENSLRDIEWSMKTNKETYEMYETLEKDMASFLKAGVITESEYLNSFANKELYRIKLLINNIDLIIYNNTTRLLFYRDSEIEEEK